MQYVCYCHSSWNRSSEVLILMRADVHISTQCCASSPQRVLMWPSRGLRYFSGFLVSEVLSPLRDPSKDPAWAAE